MSCARVARQPREFRFHVLGALAESLLAGARGSGTDSVRLN